MSEIIIHHTSYLFNKPIEVSNIWWEIIVTITNRDESESVYSWYDLVEKESYSTYINKCILWWLIKWVPKKVLIIWFGWGSFVKFLEDHFTDIEITWIDIERAMYEICKNILEVKADNLLVWDADSALDDLINIGETYDLVLFDVYWNDSKIPEKFTTLEFIKKMKDVLTEKGVFWINMSGFEQEKEMYETIHSSLKKVFWNQFSLFLTWINDASNMMWIYNLDKKYSAKEFDENYKQLVKAWVAIKSTEIIKNTVVDEAGIYLH